MSINNLVLRLSRFHCTSFQRHKVLRAHHMTCLFEQVAATTVGCVMLTDQNVIDAGRLF